METLILLIIAGTLILGSYLLVNLTFAYFSNGEHDPYGNYNKRKRENQAFDNFQRRISKKSGQLRSKVL